MSQTETFCAVATISIYLFTNSAAILNPIVLRKMIPTEQIQTSYGREYDLFFSMSSHIIIFHVSGCQVNYNRCKNQTSFHILRCQNVGNKNNKKSEPAENNEVRGMRYKDQCCSSLKRFFVRTPISLRVFSNFHESPLKDETIVVRCTDAKG